MSDDIVTRLRAEIAKAEVAGVLPSWELAKTMWEAADEIERLQAEVSRLGSFLHPIGTVVSEQAVRGE